ncbi:hypothetical protein B0H14DRAFT_3862797 [Mycena olivaceomarginata]|nr:hypothetical protein B0H14DRAFT_3862797 [Mycena olivaceomarginata]
MLAFLAAHVALSPSRTPWRFSSVLLSPPDACACGTPWHHLHYLLRAQCAQWSFPIAGAAFIASSRAKCVCNKSLSPIQTHAGRIINTARTTPLSAHPIGRAAAITFPRAATMSNASLSSAQTQLLSDTGSTTRSIAGARSKCNECSRRPCRLQRLPAPGAGFLCAHAGLCYKPRPAAQREHDGHHPLRCAAHAAAVPPSPHTHVHPQCHTAPLVDDSAAPPPMRSMPRGSFPSPAPATSAAMTLPRAGSTRTTRRQCAPRASTFHARDLSQVRMEHRDKSRCDEPGRRHGTYAAPGFQIAPRPVQFESPASAASTGRGTA